MIFKILFYGFLIYLLYRLVFHFILPVYRTTKQVKQSFRKMQETMQQQTNAYSTAQPQQPYNSNQPKNGRDGDYIEFEEVR